MDDGYATAEAAIALPALVVVLGLAVGAVVVVGGQLRCVDAARAAARVAARGDDDAAAARAALEVAPPGARVRVAHEGRDVQVTVAVTMRAGRWLPGFPLIARATSEAEGAR
ncbi:MAG: TadE family type IV pilus minor pilin [Mycobacteriales bacterium]